MRRARSTRSRTSPTGRSLPGTATVAALFLVGCSSVACSGDDTGRPGGDATSGTLQLVPSTTTMPAPETSALLDVLLEGVPLQGFVPADDVLGAGPLDLEGAAAAERDVGVERSLLRDRSFERGVSRAWLDPDQAVAYVAVYEFATAHDADAYLEDTSERLTGRGATPFEVPDVPGAAGFTTVEDSASGGFTAHAVAFTSGDLWVLALVGSPGSGRTPDDARALASAQAARLG